MTLDRELAADAAQQASSSPPGAAGSTGSAGPSESLTNAEKGLLMEAALRGIRYRASMARRRVAPEPAGLERLALLGGPMREHGDSAARVIADLDDVGSPATMAVTGSRYFGFVIGGSLPVTVAANWLATAWDQNAGLTTSSPVSAALEAIALEWLLDLLDLPRDSAGAFVTGGTTANFTALAAARHGVLERAGWDVESDGMSEAPAVNVVVSEETHPSVFRSLGLLGLGRQKCVTVPTDAEGRLRAELLPDLDGPTIVCTQAGNVNTGAVDPLWEICDWAERRNAWVHVDGAFGLWARVAPARAPLLRGHHRADSWAVDAHKWLNVPYDCGIALVRRPSSLRAAMALSADYLPAEGAREPMHYTPELSRRARGVEVWAALRTLGRRGLADLIERCCQHAAHFARRLPAAGAQVLNRPVLNQVLVSFGTDETTRRVVEAVQRDGTCWCGPTVWKRRTAMRISVSSWATTEADVEMSITAILRCAREVAGRGDRPG